MRHDITQKLELWLRPGPVKPKIGCFLPGTGVLFGELKTPCGSPGGPSNRVDEYEFLKIPSLPRGSL